MASLGDFALLERLSENDLETLRGYLEERHFDADAELFTAGEESSELYLVIEGRVRLEREGMLLAELGKGEALGGLGLTRVGKRESAARACEPVRVLALDRVAYHRLRIYAPATALALAEALLREVANAVRETLRGLEANALALESDEVDGEGVTH
jgi:CRP-like cAMP-binding protein